MPKNIVMVDLQRPHTGIPWGFVICGGRDQGLTLKIGNVKRMTPASRGGLCKMDYLISINDKPVFNMTHDECCREIKQSGQVLRLECERGDHIVPSFEELFPGLRGDNSCDGTNRKMKIGIDYYQDAMNNHGLGHLPQPDNFTTVGNKLGIEINQYNCPINAYSENSIEEMREQKEKGGMDNLEMFERIPQEIKDSRKFDPTKSNSLQIIQLEERGNMNPGYDGRST